MFSCAKIIFLVSLLFVASIERLIPILTFKFLIVCLRIYLHNHIIIIKSNLSLLSRGLNRYKRLFNYVQFTGDW